jgi:hypothetical protein
VGSFDVSLFFGRDAWKTGGFFRAFFVVILLLVKGFRTSPIPWWQPLFGNEAERNRSAIHKGEREMGVEPPLLLED